MKYKKNDWANFNDDRGLEVKYGIDVVVDGKTMHVSENGKPLYFDNEKERDNKIKELNSKQDTKPIHDTHRQPLWESQFREPPVMENY